jgi:hypothetical protein
MRSRMIGLAAVVVFATLALVACTTSTEQGTVGVERSQLLLVSSAEMDQAAAVQYQQLIHTETRRATSITIPSRPSAPAESPSASFPRRRSSARTRWTGSGRSTC